MNLDSETVGHGPVVPLSSRQKQSLFVRLLGRLFTYADGWGYEFVLGEVHPSQLAQDLHLFVKGQRVEERDHPVWRELGRYWKGLHPLAVWGGDFATHDYEHFSLRDSALPRRCKTRIGATPRRLRARPRTEVPTRTRLKN